MRDRLTTARWVQPLLFEQPARDPLTYGVDAAGGVRAVDAVHAVNPSKNTSIFFLIAASGIGPRAAPRLSITYSTFSVPGITHVTAGCDTMYFKNTCAHVVAAISLPQSGMARSRTR